jgi:WXG100 family type VII secretion target
MPKYIIQLNYDELKAIAKKFRDEGEDITRLHSNTRQRVRDMYKEWIGEAADKFFDEMEHELLPALERLGHGLFFSQDVVNQITKTFHDADEETSAYFKTDLSGDDFGAGKFSDALGGVQGGTSGPDDFGAGKFGDALGGVSGGDASSSPDDFGANKFGEALPNQQGNTPPEPQQGGGEQQGKTPEKMPETQTSSAGDGGSGSSQGLQGDLKGLGAGLGNQTPQTASVSGGSSSGGQNMPDHIYGGSSDSGGSGTPQPPPGGGSSGGTQSPGGSGDAAAAGAAGVIGTAAAGGVAKVIKDNQEKDE